MAAAPAACASHADAAAHACIREISAQSAFLKTNARPPLGARAEIRHPEAGRVSATVAVTALTESVSPSHPSREQ
jgi:hypothetical protein